MLRRPVHRLVADLEFPAARGPAAYGPMTTELLLRARVLALFLCAALAVYAHNEGMNNLKREAIEGLARATVD